MATRAGFDLKNKLKRKNFILLILVRLPIQKYDLYHAKKTFVFQKIFPEGFGTKLCSEHVDGNCMTEVVKASLWGQSNVVPIPPRYGVSVKKGT